MALHVRAAQPGDLPFLAWAMQESTLAGVGQGLFDRALDGTSVSPLTFHEALLRVGASNWGGVEDFLILQDESQTSLAAAAGFTPDPKDLRPLTAEGFSRVSQALGWSSEISRQFWSRYVAAFGLFGTAPQLRQPAEYVVEYVAVLAERRGQGLVSKLLEGHRARARARGAATMGISVLAGNQAALKAYRKFGFVVHRNWTAEELGGAFPGITRLVRALEPVASSRKDEDVSHGINL